MSRLLAYCCALSLLIGTGNTPAEQVVLFPARDNTLFEHPGGSLGNGAGAYLFVGRTGQPRLRRGLLSFDVAGQVPAGATVTAASLSLHLSKTTAGPVEISLYPVLSAWGEGTSDAAAQEGKGVPALPGDATWIHTFADTARWATPGGDFATPASATAAVDQVGFYAWESPALTAQVQAWLVQPATNLGWLLSGGESTDGSAKRFDSREHPEPGNRPTLTITYDATAVAPATWGKLKEQAR